MLPGLVAAAALLIDYMLTVVGLGRRGRVRDRPRRSRRSRRTSWSCRSGSSLLVTLANLRGVRESGTLFAVPTYAFIVSIIILVVTGIGSVHASAGVPVVTDHVVPIPGAGQHRPRGRPVRDPARVLVGLDRAHRGRGDLERGPGVPSPAVEERLRDAPHHGDHLGHDVPGDLVPGDPHPRDHRQRATVGRRPDRARGVRRRVLLLLRAVLHDGDPGARGEHRRTRTSRVSRRSWRATGSCRGSSPTAATGWCSRTA